MQLLGKWITLAFVVWLRVQFSTILLVIFAGLLVSAILAYIYKTSVSDQIETGMIKVLNRYGLNDSEPFTNQMDYIQKKVHIHIIYTKAWKLFLPLAELICFVTITCVPTTAAVLRYSQLHGLAEYAMVQESVLRPQARLPRQLLPHQHQQLRYLLP